MRLWAHCLQPCLPLATRRHPEMMAKRGIQATNVILQPSADLLRRVAQVVDAGQLKVPIDRTYPLEQAVEALEHSEHGHVRGKLVVTMR